MLHRRLLILLALLLALGAGVCTQRVAGAVGPDKSGVKPNVINLPAGPGSIQGLGEKFQPQLNTGTASYRLPIAVPPGVGEHTPELTLRYDGGHPNGPFGLGWRLDLPLIQRQTDKGLPRYDDSGRFIHSSGEELVPVGDGVYRFKVEGQFTRFRRLGEGWEATERDGTRWLFGQTAEGQQRNELGVFLWQPQQVFDTNGNELRFFYQEDAGQLYLHAIRYNFPRGSAFGQEPADRVVNIEFEYGDRPDAFTDYRSRFRVQTALRVQAITIKSLGQQVRRYEFGYDARAGVSLLVEVRELGADLVRFEDAPTEGLPPLRLSYTLFDPAHTQPVTMTQPPLLQVGDPNVDLVDINSDALPDVVYTPPGDAHRFYLNQGRGRWAAQPLYPATAPPDVLATGGVQLADIDGDSRSDLLVKAGDTSGAPLFYYYPNRGGNAWELADRVDLGFNPPFTFEDPDLQLVDLDNDKRIDVLRTTESRYYVYFNRPTGWSDGADPVLEPLVAGAVVRFGQPGVSLADMNGDQLQDMVIVLDTQVVYFPARGFGAFDTPLAMTNSPQLTDRTAEARHADINGDGMADLLLVERTSVRAWLSQTGVGYGDEIVFANTPEYIAGETTLRLADMDGDGATDLLYSTYPAATDNIFRYLDFSGDVRPYLLSTIDNGLGRVIGLTYRTSTDYYVEDLDAGSLWTLRSPVPVPVVSRSTIHDKASGQTYRTDYRYRNAYYDAQEKAFRGFALAEQIDIGDSSAPTQTTRALFDTGASDESRKGLLLQWDEMGEAGNCGEDLTPRSPPQPLPSPGRGCYRRTLHQLATRTLITGTDGRLVTFSVITQTDVLHYETTATPRRQQQTFAYDDYGNQIEEFDYGEVAADGSAPALGHDERLTYTSYAITSTAWILDRVAHVRQTDLAGNFVSEQRRYYDGAPFVGFPLGQLTHGNLTRQEDNLGPAADNRWIQSNRYRYDEYGNQTGVLDANGNLDASGEPSNGHWRAIGYDPLFHVNALTETLYITTGHALTLTADYDLVRDVITRSVDFNGQETLYRYDGLARLRAVIKPGDTLTLPTQIFTYTLGNGISAVTTATRQRSGSPDLLYVVSYIDGLERILQTRSQGEDKQVIVRDAVTFNARGSEWKKFQPYYAITPTLAYGVPEADQPKSSLRYDPLLRTVEKINPDGTVARTRYLPLAEEVADEEDTNPNSPHFNTHHTFRYDGLDRLVQVLERNGGEVYTTTYGYDLLDNLTVITDTLGNVKRQAFDGLKRKLFSDDPDRGRMTYAYDAASNLVATVDAKGQQIRYTYDGLNRLLSENYVVAPSDDTPDVRYHYDDERAPEYVDAANTRGRLAWSEDMAGREYLSYDARGNLAGRIRRLPALITPSSNLGAGRGGGNATLDFVTLTRYDAMDRPIGLTFPDGVTVTFDYNRQTLLEAIPGYVDDIDYNAAEQQTNLVTADGVTTTYAYDARLRLTALRSLDRAGAALQDLRYQLDGVNNILSIEDARSEHTKADDETRTFGYDHLYRLTGVRYAAGDAIDYGYDPIGNLIRQTATITAANLGDLHYGQDAGPHALTGISAERRRYDANGNLVARAGFTYTWDFLNRLVAVDGEDNLRQDHVYDYAGERTIKQTHTATDTQLVLYPDPAVEVRDGQLIKYIFAKDQRIAEVRTPFDPARLIRGFAGESPAASPAAAIGEAETVFYHADHLGSSTLLVDSGGKLVERAAYHPYGTERLRSGDAGVTRRFSGKELDRETGLYDYDARFYDPVVGRFLSPDPLYAESPEEELQNPQALNLYAYTLNNPVKYVDPTGKDWLDIVQVGLDVVGMVPVVGEAADLANAGIYTARGDYVNAGLSAAAAVPGAGNVATAAKWGRKGYKAVDEASDVAKSGRKAADESADVAQGGKKVDRGQNARRQGGCPNSFTANTLVPTGVGVALISQLQAGDLVWAWDEATGVTGLYTVTAVLVHLDPTLVYLTLNGERIETTPEHPFYVPGRGWIAASELQTGDRVSKLDGSEGLVQAVVRVSWPRPMYNLTVAGAHTFFVGSEQWLVHNCPPGFSLTERAQALARRLGKNSIKIGLPNGRRMRIDLQGATHKRVETPHVHIEKRNVNPHDPSKVRYSTVSFRAATARDLRLAERVLRQRELRVGGRYFEK